MKKLLLIGIIGIIIFNLNIGITPKKSQSLTLTEQQAKACSDMEGIHGYVGLMQFCTRYVIFSTFPWSDGWVAGCRDANETCTLP